jgi:SAM-dependent methyltransferase
VNRYRVTDELVPYVSTAEFHADRERARHLEQPAHRPRLLRAAEYVLAAVERFELRPTVVDVGCGDGGLLSLLKDAPVHAWGYDFAPANVAGWVERGVEAYQRDVFGADQDRVTFGDITVMTEVLEHLADPYAAVRWVGEHSRYIVASSPWAETREQHDECHCWAFDPAGYRALIEQGGFRILRQEFLGMFQVVLGWRP